LHAKWRYVRTRLLLWLGVFTGALLAWLRVVRSHTKHPATVQVVPADRAGRFDDGGTLGVVTGGRAAGGLTGGSGDGTTVLDHDPNGVHSARATSSVPGAWLADAPYLGAALPRADGSAPSPDYTVKGNPGSMLYHTTESPYYRRTKAGAWFRTEEDAQRAGFSRWSRRPRGPTTPSPEPGPYPGSIQPRADGSSPAGGFAVKGDTTSMLYHTADSPQYAVVEAGVWFRSEADARRAGFATWKKTAG
jgi:hypothetical protein